MTRPVAARGGVAASREPARYLKTLATALLVAASMPAEAGVLVPGSGGPGSVVADIRAQLAFGTSYALGSMTSGSVDPEVLLIWPGGRGFGIGLSFGIIGGPYNGGTRFVGVGPKFAVVGPSEQASVFSKFGFGLLALSSLPGGIGGRAVLEYGIAPLVAGRVLLPVEAFLSGQLVPGAGLSAVLGLSVGAGWVFGASQLRKEL
jgi:hypothetical protein